MHINPNADIGGVPAFHLRHFLRTHESGLTVADIEDFFGLPEDAARQLVRQLTRLGYLESGIAAGSWTLTGQGRKLARAKANPPIYRYPAERLLRGFLDRVEQVNADASFLYRVERAVLCGDIIGASDWVTSIDVGIELASRYPPARQQAACERQIEAAAAAGRTFYTHEERHAWPRTQVLRELRQRSSYFNFLSIADAERSGPCVELIHDGLLCPAGLDQAMQAWRDKQHSLTDAERVRRSAQLVRRLEVGPPLHWETITREQLELLIWRLPATAIAEKFGIADRTVSRKCRRMGIAVPSAAYRAKVHHRLQPKPKGKPVDLQTLEKVTDEGLSWSAITRDELERLVWSMPTRKAAARLGISDVMIGKKCRALGIAKPPPGFWRKVERKFIPDPGGRPPAEPDENM